jgi:diguanylate cyclase
LPVNNEFFQAVNLRKWNRKMLNAYWFIVLAVIMVEILYLIIESVNHNTYLTQDFFQFPALIIAILTATEILNAWMKQYNEYLIIVCGTAVTITGLFFHSNILSLFNAIFLPILISAFYFQVRKVMFAFAVNFVACTSLFYTKFKFGEALSLPEIVSILFILICGTFICIGIMHRGIELLNRLNSTLATKQELLIKNIIMDRLSKLDPLTELYNHITFHEYLDRLSEQSDVFELPLQLTLLDIDNFKKVNDTFGHRAGDAVLKRVAAILQEYVKPNDFVARYGGEEFAILFTEKSMHESREIMENIRRRIAVTPNPELNEEFITISAGLVEYERGSGKETFFRLADEALYTAKKSGKNRIVLH